ncbi:PIN domain-containing protein [Lyngbya sp. CCY1209]|uniref:PIN domain-containing protein n=1 Tax=Lyngbya sp. CCY1209 TaxID=2886103 RepID=UPI002D2163B8|nr:PIN domain-containing protein [Lyngbya sp. CCY1209]MEB3882681.1 PIN domain-containing protein [Lyngbya sp. CCY1209]
MQRIFLDTNVYILAQLNPRSNEEAILRKLGFYDAQRRSSIQVIISQELIEQILRVCKRIQNKDWGAKIVDQIWQNLNCLFVPETEDLKAEAEQILTDQLIPTEDIFIYLTAKYGQADCFVSANRKLIQTIADFPCFTPEDFVQHFLTI